MSVDLDILYTDQSDVPSHISSVIQKHRTAEIYAALYSILKVPKFPVILRKYVGIRCILEDFSRRFPQACFCFIFETKCLVLNEGSYSFYNSYEDAKRDYYQKY